MTMQMAPAEIQFAEELAFLQAWDDAPRPQGWLLTPRAIVTFICGSDGELLKLPKKVKGVDGTSMKIPAKFIGDRGLIERSVVTLASERGLLLVGEPGTAKSMLSELLAAAISGTSALTVQGSAGTTEDQLRYSWNYASLMSAGPSLQALVPSPVLIAMRRGAIVRVEEVTRCLPEVQDALISIISERRLVVPELEGEGQTHLEFAQNGFNVISTANLRDRGVSEMSAALKRRYNFELVPPIESAEHEKQLVDTRARQRLQSSGVDTALDEVVLDALVTSFRDLRNGQTHEGWPVEKPGSVMSTAECVSVASSIALQSAWFGQDPVELMPGHLLGCVMKDDPQDRGRLLAYWDGPVRRRAEADQQIWKKLAGLRNILREADAATL